MWPPQKPKSLLGLSDVVVERYPGGGRLVVEPCLPIQPLRSKSAISLRLDSAVALVGGDVCNGESVEEGELAMSSHAYSDALFCWCGGMGSRGSESVVADRNVLPELTDSRTPSRAG